MKEKADLLGVDADRVVSYVDPSLDGRCGHRPGSGCTVPAESRRHPDPPLPKGVRELWRVRRRLRVMNTTKSCAVIGGLLLGCAGLALLNPFHWIGLGDLLWLWPMVASLGLVALGVVCVRITNELRGKRRLVPVLAIVVIIPLFLAGAGIGGLVLLFQVGEDTRVVDVSPDGRFEILIHHTSNVIDPVQAVYVQTTSGPFSKRIYLGCLNRDTVDSASFSGPGTVLVTGGGEQWSLDFDPGRFRAIETLPDDSCAKNLYTG